MLYERIGQSEEAPMPAQPPSYNDLPPDIEQFEIEDIDTFGATPEGFLSRASFVTKKFAHNFNNRIIHPVSKIIDPIYEGYKYFSIQYEKSILKLGNPLVVKRLLYVFFIMILIFLVTRLNVSEGVNSASGGAFLAGKFYDIPKLTSSAQDYVDKRAMKVNLEYLSLMPHITGSKGDLTLSKYIEKYMTSNGVNVIDFHELESFTNYPVYNNERTYVRLADGSIKASLSERDNHDMEYLAYNPNSLSMTAEIEASYVFVNYGTKADYDALKAQNVEFKDRIVLIKYGGNVPEPNKVRLAEEMKAKAVVFITEAYDSYDDAIQRKNVGMTRLSPGDVLTPGWSSEDGYVTRIPWHKSELTPKIPTIPISWKDGKQFCDRLSGGAKFDDLESGDGKGPRMKLLVENEERTTHLIWNVVGSIPGRDQSEKGIIIGAARDAACFGTRSSTGSVILLELVKVFTSLQRQYNWSPARSIYFVSFDATLYNLAGAGEWVEKKKNELKDQAYAYIDLSDAVTGDKLEIRSNPLLHELIRLCLKDVDLDKRSLYEVFKQANGGSDRISNNLIELKNYIPFINKLNIPSMELRFTGKDYPKDSCYDDFEGFEREKVDELMHNHDALAKLIATVALNLAELPIIPYNFIELGDRLLDYQHDLERFVKSEIDKLDQPNKPNIHYVGLTQGINVLKDTARKFHDWAHTWGQFLKESGDVEPSLLAMNRWKWNDYMLKFNNDFLVEDVKPERTGYNNRLFGVAYNAPAKDDGSYQWNSFPAVRDYVMKGDFGRVQHEIDHVSNLIAQAAENYIHLSG